MDQEPQYPSTNPGSPYEFILNPQQHRKKRFSLGGGNLPLIIGAIVGGAILLMIVIAAIASLLGGSGSANKDNLIGLAQTQHELIRVSNQGVVSATQQTTKNFAITIEYSMTTQQQGVTKLLSGEGVKLSSKDLVLKQNAVTDQQLAKAKTTSTFDEAFAKIMQSQLENYANTLKQLRDSASSKAERDLSSDYYQQTQFIISQIPYAQASSL